MKKIIALSIVALSLVLFSGTQSFAQQGTRPNRPLAKNGFVKKGLEKVFKELALTDKQKSDIKALRIENGKKNVDLKASLEKSKLDTRSMLNSGKLDKDTYLKSVENENKILAEIRYNNAELKTRIYDLLTDEQKTVFMKYADKFLGSREGGPGKFHR